MDTPYAIGCGSENPDFHCEAPALSRTYTASW
jgi:hypothetical protein